MQITDPLPWGFTVQNPLPPIDSQDGLFHDGNPVTGELGTVVPSSWLNNVQGAIRSNQTELVSVLSAAGIAPDAARPDQLLAALQALYLGKAAQAADSAKLEGHPASYFAKADDLAKAGSDPLLWPRTSPSRTHIQAGYAPLDGQELSRALYPDAWAAIQAGAVPVVTEAEWQTDPLKRGAWTYGNGSTTFRMPDWNGKSAGSKGAVFVRGDGALSAGTPGRMQSDGVGTVSVPTRSTTYTGGWEARYLSSFATLCPGITLPGEAGWNGALPGMPVTSDRTNTVNMGSAETRPLNVTGVWVCRLFGAVTNPGAADASQLATIFSPNNSMPLENRTRLRPKRKKPPLSKPLRGVVKFGIYLRAYKIPAMPIGILIRKIQCQLAQVTSTPPNTGPRMGPTRPGMVTKLSTGRSSLRG